MKNLKLTLLAAIVAITTSCSKSELAEVKPEPAKTGAIIKTELQLDSIRTKKLPDTLGKVRYQDTFFVSLNNEKLETVGTTRYDFFIGIMKLIRPKPGKVNFVVTRNKANVKYTIDVNFKHGFRFESTNE